MRIAYVVPAYPMLAQTFIVNEMIGVQEAGHEVVITPLYSAPPSSIRHEAWERLRPVATLPAALFDLRVGCLALWVLCTHLGSVLRTLLPLLRATGLNLFGHARLLAVTPKALATAWRLKRARVDRIHAHFASLPTTCAGIAASISGIPFSFVAHSFDVYCTSAYLRNDTLDWKLRHAVQVFAVSEHISAVLRGMLPVAESDRIHTVYVGIPMGLFREEPAPPRDEGLQLLCVARLHELKGLDTLVDACALLRDRGLSFHLRLYGDGPLRSALTDQIARLDLTRHVTLGGPISQHEVARRMKACHVFVMPCRRERNGNMDGIPTVFMEAMATGRPVISSRLAGIPELVRHGETGLLVPPDDAPALAAAVMELADGDEFRIRLGRQARAVVERQHDQRINARRLVDLIARASAPRRDFVDPTISRSGLDVSRASRAD